MTTALITGASSGIGTLYARRLAARGHDLVLVARRTDRHEALAAELRAAHGAAIDIMTADLTDGPALEAVAGDWATGTPIDILVNNAGASLPGGLVGADPSAMDRLLKLNVVAPTMLASAAATEMVERGRGAIVNVASVLAFVPEMFPGIYSATKSYILNLSRGLAAEVGPKGVYVQAVVPAATRTEIWEHSGTDVSQIPGLMDVDALVDAALIDSTARRR